MALVVRKMPLQFMWGQWRFIFNGLMMFYVIMGIRYGFEDEDLVVSGREFTSGGRLGVHGKARHFFFTLSST
ncbi:hypothetical protein GLYMA_02G258700v4 [Glycine max]|uniref:Uncharacterized protein n=2 Tax=Glycine subgen. Soja TaxID=1462606 RepID=K7KAT4_SOYBN|nr:hypothetical protein JHK87_005266 [Glycine soja]KAH1062112.1 hypothetical protein GYH30_005228 [Glycine max]KHN38575.1 hypothetical protein glysoja_004240 [Glycine soja]KRH73210.1 hypothetical protein GLYMA_02G258700v4 [Glycine max]RZC26776.1 hypothetical protein D0Y65_005100 [Glycine soja]